MAAPTLVLPAEIFLRPEGGDSGWQFDLPPELESNEPPEARGLARDEVRLMVSCYPGRCAAHAVFRDLPRYLKPGDVLVINTSGTMSAALPAARADGSPLELHLSTRLPADLWIVELRRRDGARAETVYDAAAGERLALPGGGSALLLKPYHRSAGRRSRLWVAALDLPGSLPDYLDRYGFPIRYGYVPHEWPSSYYQTVYTTEVGSAEMPSAGRAFTPELITRLVAHGVQFAPLLLHAGVASPEDGEPPYEEYYRVPLATAQAINAAKAARRRVIAVGTTVVRALETVSDEQGAAHPGEGLTRVVVTAERGVRSVDGLLTGLHEPRSTHLAMLAALAGIDHLRFTYEQALRLGYRWHEFGDLHLLLQGADGRGR